MATSTSVTTSAAQAPALRKQLGRDGVRPPRPSTIRRIAPANNLALSFSALAALSSNPSPPVIGGTLVYSPATIAEGATATRTTGATGSIPTTASPLPLRLPRQTNPTQPQPQQKQTPSQQQKTNQPHLSPTVSQQRPKQPPLSLARNLPNATNNNPAATNGNTSSPMWTRAVGVGREQERQVDASDQQPLVQELLCLINDQKQQEQVLQQKVQAQTQAAFLKQMEVLQQLKVQCQQQQQLLQLQRLHQLQEEQRRVKEQEEERERQMKESELLKRWEEQRQVQLRYLQEQQLQKSLEQQLQKKLTLQTQQYERQEVLQPQPQHVRQSPGEPQHRTTDQLQNQQQVQELPQPQQPPHQLLQSLSSQTESLASLLQEAVHPETLSSQVELLQLLKNLSSQHDMLSVLQHTDPAQHEKILHLVRHLLALCYTNALTASSSVASPSVSTQRPSQSQPQTPTPAEPQTPHQLLLPQQKTKPQINHVSNNTQSNRSSQPHYLINSPSSPLPFTTASPYLTSSFSPLSNLTKTNVPHTVKLSSSSTPRQKESTKREEKAKTFVERTESAKNNSENAKNNNQHVPAIFGMRIGGFDYLKELGLELVADALKRQEQRESEEGTKEQDKKNGKPKVRQLKEERRQKRKVLREERRQQRLQIRELKRNNRLKKRRNRVTSNKASSARKAEPPSFLPPPTLLSLPSPQRTERVELSPETAKEEEIRKMAEAARKRVYGGHSFDDEDQDEEEGESDAKGNDDDDPANNDKEKEVKHGDISVMDERRRLALASLKRLNYLKPTKEERLMKKEWRKELREQRKREKERKRKEREQERESKQQQKKVKLWTREERRKQLLNNSNNNE
ncbi:hypothetical protein QOT17_005429 [Balamuthia mandrillaris]